MNGILLKLNDYFSVFLNYKGSHKLKTSKIRIVKLNKLMIERSMNVIEALVMEPYLFEKLF